MFRWYARERYAFELALAHIHGFACGAKWVRFLSGVVVGALGMLALVGFVMLTS
jgi:hypothetical protein